MATGQDKDKLAEEAARRRAYYGAQSQDEIDEKAPGADPNLGGGAADADDELGESDEADGGDDADNDNDGFGGF